MKYVRNHKKSSTKPGHVPIYPGVLPWAVAEDDSFQEELTCFTVVGFLLLPQHL